MKIKCLLIGMSLCVLLWCGGCSSSGGGAPYTEGDHTPPTLSDFSITPPQNGWRAGDCIIEVKATDNIKVASVSARVSGPNVDGGSVPLLPVTGTPNLYRGKAPVPANTDPNGMTNTYFVTAWATDNDGNSSTVDKSLMLTVPPPEAPPGSPGTW